MCRRLSCSQVDTAQRDHHPYVNVLTLYVGNLAARVDEPVLMGAFNHIGPITNIQASRYMPPSQSLSCALHERPCHIAKTALTNTALLCHR